MFLLDSGRFASDPEGMTSKLLALLEKVNATVAVHRPWQDGKLAYPIGGMRKGTHYLVYFRMDPSQVKTLNRECQLSDIIVRHLVIKPPQQIYDAMVQTLGNPEAEVAEAESDAGEPAAKAAASSDG